ncbi:MAG: NAD(P)/FAD-dependent oxidoreductase, partial [Pseudomonadota bacterium]
MDLTEAKKILVIGGGQAGAQTVTSLRQWGYEGDLKIICDETALPYQRPPLSKAYMKGEMEEHRLYFKPADWYDTQNIEVLSAVAATQIDRSTRTVTLSNGEAAEYDALVLATGSRPRPLPTPGADLDGVFELRGLDDVKTIQPRMVEGKRIVIVGAGYIGLEAAAVARAFGMDVTVLEMADRVLARVTSPLMSEFYTRLHEKHGVTIRTDAKLEALIGSDEHVASAQLADGTTLDCDLVLVGIGILPNVELAEQAGLACNQGIIVEEDARTNDP